MEAQQDLNREGGGRGGEGGVKTDRKGRSRADVYKDHTLNLAVE